MSKKRATVGAGYANKRPQGPKFRLTPKLRLLMKQMPEISATTILQFLRSWHLVKILIALEIVINYWVIRNVSYTEIDWSTYMEQVGQIFGPGKTNLNYTQIEGPTGPLVYPAGHVYAFYLFKELTDNGLNIRFAQYIFLCIYMAQLILVYKIFRHKRVQVKVPPELFYIMCLTSYRIHSIYVLRLFNDPVAVLLAYSSFYALLKKRHSTSAILFSVAVSIKMNILLYAPAYALVYLEDLGFIRSLKYGSIALVTQIILAAPFLYTNPIGYLSRAFDFSRIFMHKWTVNWRFVDEKLFVSSEFAKTLLGLHLLVLFLIFWKRWLNCILPRRFALSARRDDPILTLFVANFIGMTFSRSLHYQFYSWYYHSLPMVVWATRYSWVLKLLLLGCIEFAWNQYPSTVFSSLILHCSHFWILIGLFLRSTKIIQSSDVATNKHTAGSGSHSSNMKKKRRVQ